jgi:hypothetical protein
VPHTPREQITSANETTKELLYSNNTLEVRGNNRNKVISSKISKFAKGFKIPNDKKKNNKQFKTS